MLKYFGLFLVICSLISCKNESKVKLNETEFKKDSKKGNFFDFDEVGYYFKDINQNELFKNYEKSEFKDKQSDLYKYMQIVDMVKSINAK